MLSRIAVIVTFGLLASAASGLGQDFTNSSPPMLSAQAPQVGETKPNPELAALLAGWEAASRQVATLTVVFERTDRSRKWGDQVFQGRAVFQRPNLGLVEFRKVILDDDAKPRTRPDAHGVVEVEKEPFQRIVWTGDQILQFEWDERAIYVYQLPRQDVAPGLLSVFARSFAAIPYWYQIDATRLQDRYVVRLVQAEANEAIVELVSRDAKDSPFFKRALIKLDRWTFLPDLVTLYTEGEKDQQEFRFTTTLKNQPVDNAYFHPPTSIRGWKSIGSTKLDDPAWKNLEEFTTAVETWFAKATVPPAPKVDPIKPADDPRP